MLQLRRPRLLLEALESRELLNVDLGALLTASDVHGSQQAAQVAAPVVALDGNGSRFVMAWTDVTEAGKVTVKARVLAADGSFLTDVITVTPEALKVPAGRTVKVDVAMDAAGRFAVVFDAYPNNTGAADLGLQRYDATGTAFGELRSIGTVNRLEINPVIDLAANGRIAVGFDQSTTGSPATHRLNSILYASFENLDSNTQTSISSTGGEIFPTVAFNDAGQFLLGGTVPGGQTKTPLRVFGANGSLSASTIVTSELAAVPLLTDVPGTPTWKLLTLDEVAGDTVVVVRTVQPGANVATAPQVSTGLVLPLEVSPTSLLGFTADASGNFAIAYQQQVGTDNQLLVGFFDAAGQLLAAPTVVAANVGSVALAAGASITTSLATYSLQTGPEGKLNTPVAFEIHGYLFGPVVNASAVSVDPTLSAVTPFGNERELAIYTEQHAGRLIGTPGFPVYSAAIEEIEEANILQTTSGLTTALNALFAGMRFKAYGAGYDDSPIDEQPLPSTEASTEDAAPVTAAK